MAAHLCAGLGALDVHVGWQPVSDGSQNSIRVLFVCSANLCRSVTASEYARRAAPNTADLELAWEIDSAGTSVARGNVLPPEVERQMRDLGIPTARRPAQLSDDHIAWADLILTAARRHRAAVARSFPAAVKRTFTLLQFARHIEAGRASAPDLVVRQPSDVFLLARMGAAARQPVDDSTIDIADPVTDRSASAMSECAAITATAIASIFGAITLRRVPVQEVLSADELSGPSDPA